mgnify:CR=1 FL=1
MDPNQRVIDYVKDTAEYIQTVDGVISASVLLERFLFPPEKQYSPIGKLSGGEKKRLNLLRVLATSPNFILLDEPTNNLDIYHATNLMKIIRKLSDELGKTVVTVLHEINYAAFYSDYICAFKDGRVAKFGTVDEVMTKEVLSEIYNVDFEIMNIQGRPLSIYY